MIREITLGSFGGLSGTWKFAERGISLILDDNEKGKTTIVEAIVALLYGFDARRGEAGALKEAERFKPLSGEPLRISGILRLKDGAEIVVTRDFDKNTVLVRAEPYGADLTSQYLADKKKYAVGDAVYGLSKEAFRRIACIRHDDVAAVRDARDIRRYVERESAGGGEATAAQALAILDDALTKFTGGRHLLSKSVRLDSEIAAARKELDETLEARRALMLDYAKREEETARAVDLHRRLDEAAQSRERCRYRRILLEIKRIDAERAQMENARQELEDVRRRAAQTIPAQITDSDLKEAADACARRAALIEEEARSGNAIAAADARGADAVAIIRACPYVGALSPEAFAQIGAHFDDYSVEERRFNERKQAYDRRVAGMMIGGHSVDTCLVLGDRIARELSSEDESFVHAYRDARHTLREERKAIVAERERVFAALDETVTERHMCRRKTLLWLGSAAFFGLCAAVDAFIENNWLVIGGCAAGALVSTVFAVVVWILGRASVSSKTEVLETSLEQLSEREAAMKNAFHKLAGRIIGIAEALRYETVDAFLVDFDIVQATKTDARVIGDERRAVVDAQKSMIDARTAVFAALEGMRGPVSDQLKDIKTLARDIAVRRGADTVLAAAAAERKTLDDRREECRALIAGREVVMIRHARAIDASAGSADEAHRVIVEAVKRREDYRALRAQEELLARRVSDASAFEELGKSRAALDAQRGGFSLEENADAEYASDTPELIAAEEGEASALCETLSKECREADRSILLFHDDYRAKAPRYEEKIAEEERYIERLEEYTYTVETAAEAIRAAASSVHRQCSVALNDAVGATLAAIAGGGYAVRFDQDLNITVQREGFDCVFDERRIDGMLSAGMRDQLYFAARAALAAYVSGGEAPAVPLIMDDAFVHCDDTRLLGAMRWIIDSFAAGGRQVIMTSCHRGRMEACIAALGKKRAAAVHVIHVK